MGATQVTLLPAFYSTIAASHDPTKAGSIQRVEEINALIRQVAKTERVPIENKGINLLYRNQSLKENLTFDGVHLNDNGKKIYRQVLLKMLSTKSLNTP
jgi:lysophospholipase L1-like esterase